MADIETNERLLIECKGQMRDLQQKVCREYALLSYNDVAEIERQALALKRRMAGLRGAITRSKRARGKE